MVFAVAGEYRLCPILVDATTISVSRVVCQLNAGIWKMDLCRGICVFAVAGEDWPGVKVVTIWSSEDMRNRTITFEWTGAYLLTP